MPVDLSAGPSEAASPAERVRILREAVGTAAVVAWCAGLLEGRLGPDAHRLPPLSWLGGRSAPGVLRARARGGPAYWPRVWGARGLLYAWGREAIPAVLRGLEDPEWRVREMCARVARRWEVGEAEAALAALLADPVPRVRAAAVRGLGRVGDRDRAAGLRAAGADADGRVRAAARLALADLEARTGG